MIDLRAVYLERALGQFPRLLSLLDRNPYSPTYGSFHRQFWLDKTSDFPDAVAQFAVQPLALAYANPFPGNPYYRQTRVREWIVAGLAYWAGIQHADGSFDEYYPFERGWVGPTGFTLHAAVEAFELVAADVSAADRERILRAIRRAADFVAAGESERDLLANHHAAACLAVWQAAELLDDDRLRARFDHLWRVFCTYRRAPGALVAPKIMPDRYMPWRAAEYLLAYRDARPRAGDLPPLPYRWEPFRRWFPLAGIEVRRTTDAYVLANLARGGVVKVFGTGSGRQLYTDCGILGRLPGGEIATSQWIDPRYRISVSEQELTVSGTLQPMTSTSTFTPPKFTLFRLTVGLLGWQPKLAHLVKGAIRKVLMLGTRAVGVDFRRRIRFEPGAVVVRDELTRTGDLRVTGLRFGDEFAVRYVPQSRFFHLPDLDARGYELTEAELATFHATGGLSVTRRVDLTTGGLAVTVEPVVRSAGPTCRPRREWGPRRPDGRVPGRPVARRGAGYRRDGGRLGAQAPRDRAGKRARRRRAPSGVRRAGHPRASRGSRVLGRDGQPLGADPGSQSRPACWCWATRRR